MDTGQYAYNHYLWFFNIDIGIFIDRLSIMIISGEISILMPMLDVITP